MFARGPRLKAGASCQVDGVILLSTSGRQTGIGLALRVNPVQRLLELLQGAAVEENEADER
jgi:hypothetical protein